jgi:hypothetical protein
MSSMFSGYVDDPDNHWGSDAGDVGHTGLMQIFELVVGKWILPMTNGVMMVMRERYTDAHV